MAREWSRDLYWEHFARWLLRDRLELLAFEGRVGGVPALIAAVWEAVDSLSGRLHPR